MATGTPRQVAKVKNSYTGQFLSRLYSREYRNNSRSRKKKKVLEVV